MTLNLQRRFTKLRVRNLYSSNLEFHNCILSYKSLVAITMHLLNILMNSKSQQVINSSSYDCHRELVDSRDCPWLLTLQTRKTNTSNAQAFQIFKAFRFKWISILYQGYRFTGISFLSVVIVDISMYP